MSHGKLYIAVVVFSQHLYIRFLRIVLERKSSGKEFHTLAQIKVGEIKRNFIFA